MTTDPKPPEPSASTAKFWEIEAGEWRRLYEEQRGGAAFNTVQSQLSTARAALAQCEERALATYSAKFGATAEEFRNMQDMLSDPGHWLTLANIQYQKDQAKFAQCKEKLKLYERS